MNTLALVAKLRGKWDQTRETPRRRVWERGESMWERSVRNASGQENSCPTLGREPGMKNEIRTSDQKSR